MWMFVSVTIFFVLTRSGEQREKGKQRFNLLTRMLLVDAVMITGG